MRIMFETDGGIASFPGLARPVEIDTDALPADEGAALVRAIYDVHFFELPSEAPSAQQFPDAYTYIVTVSDGEHHHTMRCSDPVPAELEPLITQLRALAKAQRAAARTNSQSQAAPTPQPDPRPNKPARRRKADR
jgi:hypothetical protein